MASKKKSPSRRKTTAKVKKGPLLASYRTDESGKNHNVSPGYIHADAVLGRIRVVEKTVTLHFAGDYNATLTYEAK